jgi:hypothetical protein
METKQHNGSTITRMIGIRLPNGRVMEAPVEVWLTAILQTLEPAQLEILFPVVANINARIQVTHLEDGMALVNKPIVGVAM